MSKSLLVAMAIVGVIVVLQLGEVSRQEEYSFERYMDEYQKNYGRTGEEEYRKYIFLKNVQTIQQHNANPEKTYTQGINQFTDFTPQQLSAMYLTLKVPSSQVNHKGKEDIKVEVDINWVTAGKVTPVGTQGQCGSSWAFSSTGSIESLYMIEKGLKEVDLSEQDLIDCTSAYGNAGCFGGGLMSNCFRYVSEKGVHEEKDYPYQAKDQSCKSVQGKKWTIGSFVGDYSGCDILLEGLSRGPTSVAVDASNFFSYKEGIFNNCGNLPNSGSLVVGVTSTYWLLRQSYGTSFGENGFIRIAPGNSCGICQLVSYPLLLI